MIKLLLGLFLGVFAFLTAAKPVTRTVFAVDNARDGKLTAETVNKGQDFIVIKQNSAKLPNDPLLLHTTNFNVYSAATLEDLQSPDAAKKLWMGKITSEGVKVYTIRNLGYTEVRVEPVANGFQAFLVTPSGKADKLTAIQLQQPKFRINVTPETLKEQKTAQKQQE
jgi:hypothetical protein